MSAMKRVLLIAALSALAVAGLGVAEAMARKGVTVKVSDSDDYGKVLMTKGNMALYLFTKDGKGPSDCYEECAVAWPPFLTKGKPVAGKGVIAGKLGTTRRDDGTPPGHLRRPPRLLLRARPPRRHPLPGRVRVRRHLAARDRGRQGRPLAPAASPRRASSSAPSGFQRSAIAWNGIRQEPDEDGQGAVDEGDRDRER